MVDAILRAICRLADAAYDDAARGMPESDPLHRETLVEPAISAAHRIGLESRHLRASSSAESSSLFRSIVHLEDRAGLR